MERTFQQYLDECGFSNQKVKDLDFAENFHNHVVKWKGRVKTIGPSELDIILDSSKTLDDLPDMMLHLLQKRIQKSSDKIQVGGDLTFRAQLLSYATGPNNVIESMLAKKEMPKSEDLPITYPEFKKRFVLSASSNPQACFESKWKSHSLKTTAEILSISETSTTPDVAAEVELKSACLPHFPGEVDISKISSELTEPIHLIVPSTLSSHISEIKKALEDKKPLHFIGQLTNRTTVHEMKLESLSAAEEVVSVPTPASHLHTRSSSHDDTKLPSNADSKAHTSQSPGLASWAAHRRAVSPNPFGRSATGGNSNPGTPSPGRSTIQRSTTPTPNRPISVGRQRMLQSMEEERKKEEQARADAERRLAMVNRIKLRSTSPAPPPPASSSSSSSSGATSPGRTTTTSPGLAWHSLKKTSATPPATNTTTSSAPKNEKHEGASFSDIRKKFEHQ